MTEKRKRATDCHCSIPTLVVCFLGGIAAVLSTGILLLIHAGATPDAALYTMAGGAIGSLGSLLTSTAPRQPQTPQTPLPITNAPGEVLETKDVTAPDAVTTDDKPQGDSQ